MASSLLFLFTSVARADVLVLVHGYLGSAASWEASGINASLEAQGWRRAGILYVTGPVVRVLPGPGMNAENKVYTVELPSIAPIMLQANILGAMLDWLHAQHPDEPVYLVGHSAGGVVARTAILGDRFKNVKMLVTIASPHSGTFRAVQALDYTDDGWPFSWFKEFFSGDTYDILEDSWGVLVDLVPPRPGNFLSWLNLQSHPDIQYVAMMRSGPVGLGDELVPIHSQDMNNVPALAGRSKTTIAVSGHRLHPGDGIMLGSILNGSSE